jgi:ABC-type multidrug transport system fused ATPase/permease subunit
VLATVNQVFSLLDPLVFRYVIDQYATNKVTQYTTSEFLRGVSLLLAAAVGVAFVSRVAKNFQDYYMNVVTQRLGAQIYSDGISHSLELPYAVFEDQRSGETLGKLQKVRTDVERLTGAFVNILFLSLVGVLFVMVYAITVNWFIAVVYFMTIPILGGLVSVLSRKIKKIQKVIVAETTALAGSTTESLRNIELVKSLGLAHHHGEDPRTRAQESEVSAQPQFRAGHLRECDADEPLVHDDLYDFQTGDHRRAVLLAMDLFVFHFRAAAGSGQRHQHLSRDGSFTGEPGKYFEHAEGATPRQARHVEKREPGGIRQSGVSTSICDNQGSGWNLVHGFDWRDGRFCWTLGFRQNNVGEVARWTLPSAGG